MDTGIIGFFCIDQQILDITGLTNRFIAKSPGGFLDKEYDPAYVLDLKPRFIVLVLKALGNDGGPPAGAGFSTWTNIERNILHHPDFNRWYRRPREIGGADEPWQDRTATFRAPSQSSVRPLIPMPLRLRSGCKSRIQASA